MKRNTKSNAKPAAKLLGVPQAQNNPPSEDLSNFEFQSIVGKGAFGSVFKV